MKKFQIDIKADLIRYSIANPANLWCQDPDEIVRIICSPETPDHRMISNAYIEQYHKSHKTALARSETVSFE